MKKKLLVLLMAVIPTLMPNLASAVAIVIVCDYTELNLNDSLDYDVANGVCWPAESSVVPD